MSIIKNSYFLYWHPILLIPSHNLNWILPLPFAPACFLSISNLLSHCCHTFLPLQLSVFQSSSLLVLQSLSHCLSSLLYLKLKLGFHNACIINNTPIPLFFSFFSLLLFPPLSFSLTISDLLSYSPFPLLHRSSSPLIHSYLFHFLSSSLLLSFSL